ncbi:PadR family transcriptional regulator [Nonomuraea glycinis]|uniref:PadR family transcriptional regulator n=1 Tax=Nonomuraea glycinis TaxID=2047744 RepID=UPI002E0FD96D|nr:PadR family transcriptional regulator [Nonomuraea glycinis]
MRATRLFILGALADGGPMHGHKIRAAAQVDRVELWADIKPGSLYGALRRMADEGVVEVVRTEQEGNLPARTVYGITDKGRAELVSVIRSVLADTSLRPDPIQLVLLHVDEIGRDELRAAAQQRRDSYGTQFDFWRNLRTVAEPHLTRLEAVAFDHTLMRLQTEVTWHDRLLAELADPTEQT